MPQPARTTFYNYALLVVLVLLVLIAVPEIAVRAMVPKEVFWPISNIYQKSTIPELHYLYRPNYSGVAFGVGLETNSAGFRGPEWTPERPPETFRIACIGDSHTFGYGVGYEQTFCKRLAELLNARQSRPVESLNFGVNGFNARQLQAVTEHLVEDFDPSLYLIVFANNDYKAHFVADDEGWLYWDPSHAANSRVRDKSLEMLEPESMPWYLEHSRLLLYLKILQKRFELQDMAQEERLDASGPPEENWMGPFPPGREISDRLAETVHKPLLEMLALAKERGKPVMIATVCTSLDYRQMFQHISHQYGVPVVELLALFPEATSWADLLEKFGLGWDPHLNEKAHERWAEALATKILEQGFLEPV